MRDGQHLDSLKIRRFRGLSDFDLDGLGSFNVLLGANDVGKTTILEAIFLLSGFPNFELPDRIQNPQNQYVHRFDALTPIFHNFALHNELRLESHTLDSTIRTLVISAPSTSPGVVSETPGVGGDANGDAVGIRTEEHTRIHSSSLALSGPRLLHYESSKVSPAGAPVSFSGTLTVRDGNLEISEPPDAFANEILVTSYLGANYTYDGSIIENIIVNKKTDDLIKYLQVVNPRVEGVTVSGDVAYLDIGLDQMIPLNMLGSGMIRAASILSTCILGNARIVLIDELENGLHFRAIRPLIGALLKLSEESGVQVIATTHSQGVLESLHEVLSQGQFSQNRSTTNCYALQRSSQGVVHSYRYEYDKFEHCIAQRIEIR